MRFFLVILMTGCVSTIPLRIDRDLKLTYLSVPCRENRLLPSPPPWDAGKNKPIQLSYTLTMYTDSDSLKKSADLISNGNAFRAAELLADSENDYKKMNNLAIAHYVLGHEKLASEIIQDASLLDQGNNIIQQNARIINKAVTVK